MTAPRSEFRGTHSAILSLHREHQQPYVYIARALGLRANRVHSFLTRAGLKPIGVHKGYKLPVKIKMPNARKCLCCRKDFVAEGPGLFMCHVCRRKDHDWM